MTYNGLDPLRLCRSALFLPASNSRAIEKARGLDADMVILDLEDAVRPEDKEEARGNLAAAFAQGFGPRLSAVRVNGPDSDHYGADVIAVRGVAADFVVLPKVEDPHQVSNARSLAEKPVLAMIETALGVLNAPAIAREAQALIVGTNDLSADLGLPPGEGRAGLTYALQATVVAARAGGIAVFDGVYNRLEDDSGLRAQCAEGRCFGFDGKSLIHPSQITTTNIAFSPTADQVAEARRLIEAATGGAERYNGRMIESMHVAEAERLLAKARL